MAYKYVISTTIFIYKSYLKLKMPKKYITVSLSKGYENKIKEILRLKPELSSKKRVIETALDAYFRLLVDWKFKEDRVLKGKQ